MIGAIILAHGDDQGLVLPPMLAPYQVVIVPIGRGEQLDRVLAAARLLLSELKQAGIRAHLDDRVNLSPGFKFNDWELRGAPLRLELGPRDLDAGTAVMAQRLGGEGKKTIQLADASSTLAAMLDDYQNFLLERATVFRDSHTAVVDDWPAFQQAVSTGWALAFHCGDTACEDEIKAETAATARCVPLDGRVEAGTCVRCNGRSAYGKRVIFGRAY
jgi:prolyl-tRNA synthetase